MHSADVCQRRIKLQNNEISGYILVLTCACFYENKFGINTNLFWDKLW